MTTPHAAAAQSIRKQLKALGIKASVTSERFAGGNAVRVATTDIFPAESAKILQLCRQHEYGTFDGMDDSYNYNNVDDSIPQVKYVNYSNRISQEMEQKILNHIRPGLVAEGNPYGPETLGTLIRRVFDDPEAMAEIFFPVP